ncbi:MAG: 16S rRNA (cytosine(1402)-N(4))-methyltransferase RsmH [Tenacibaculum sp.]
MVYHNPVLLNESVAALDIKEDGVYVDATFGGGGHSAEILKHLGKKGRLFAFDQDSDTYKNQIKDPRVVLIINNFRFAGRYLRLHGVKKVDGILADLGVSSHQLNVPERGFSTRLNSNLDMRMNQKAQLSAKTVINQYKEKELADILFLYGELSNARTLAKTIVKAREKKDINTSFQLKEVLQRFIPKTKEHKILAQIFQAFRIEVNQELSALKELLQQIPKLLNKQGRLSVISYHSLEDRLVKRYINTGAFTTEPIKDLFGNTNKPLQKVGKLIVPTRLEIKNNNRARSAKLRVAKLNITYVER